MKTTEEQSITQQTIDKAMNYGEYREMIDTLLEEGKTTGPKQSEGMTEYTRMNVQRMQRLDKTTELNASLKQKLEDLDKNWICLVLTEAWCGDAAQNVPVIHKMAEVSPNIDLKFILRDEHTDIMDQYLTNGGRSIPKLVCLDAASLDEIGEWGPRPASIQKKAMQWKDDPEISKKEWAEKLHKWYAEDKTEELQSEFESLLVKWS